MAESVFSGDWRSKCKTVPERWYKGLKKDLHTDVNFLVGEGEDAKSFTAHKIVLAFSSPVFEAMLFGELAERIPIVIIDIEPEAFDTLLGHAYGNTITFRSLTAATNTYIVADKYLVTDLQTSAKEYITKATMDDREFWEVIQQDRFFHIPVVKKKCLDYIAKNGSTLFKSCFLSKISESVMEAILQMDQIKVTENEMLSALVRWGYENVAPQIRLRDKLELLLSYIRFSNITLDEFFQFTESYPSILDPADSLKIAKHIHKKNGYELPEWCSTSSNQRNYY